VLRWSAESLGAARAHRWVASPGAAAGPLRLAVVQGPGEDAAALAARAQQALSGPETRDLRGEHGAYFTDAPAGPGQLAALFPSEGLRGAPRIARLVQDAAQRARSTWTSLAALGIHPSLAAGHSAGELAAATALGLLDLDVDALVRIGADIDAADSAPVALLSVLGAPEGHVRELLRAGAGLYLCADDSPRHQLLGGEAERVREAATALAAAGALCRELPWPISAHTPLFRPFAEALHARFHAAAVQRPDACLYSSAEARPFPWEDPPAARMLLRNQWLGTVRFRETVEAMYASGARAFVELPGRQGLAGYVTDTLGPRPHLSLALSSPDTRELAHLAAALWVHHLPVDVARLDAALLG
jgi:acyl transferase domain-containing protein